MRQITEAFFCFLQMALSDFGTRILKDHTLTANLVINYNRWVVEVLFFFCSEHKGIYTKYAVYSM